MASLHIFVQRECLWFTSCSAVCIDAPGSGRCNICLCVGVYWYAGCNENKCMFMVFHKVVLPNQV